MITARKTCLHVRRTDPNLSFKVSSAGTRAGRGDETQQSSVKKGSGTGRAVHRAVPGGGGGGGDTATET